MKGDKIVFYGGGLFLETEKIRRAASAKRRLERNPFLEPLSTLLARVEDEESRWRARASKFLRACYKEAESRLGEDRARALFVGAVPKRNRGHQKGQTGRPGLLPDLDAVLLAAYQNATCEAQTERERRTIPRQLAERLYADGSGRYGNSVEAIARHLRRLLKVQEKRATDSAEHHLRLFAAYKDVTGEDLSSSVLSVSLADCK
jgi:hypothetical protein